MKSDTASFIADEYRPPGITFQDPRNMHLDDIRKVLKHCYVRQAESGPESSFRLKMFIGPKRRRLFAEYPDPSNARPTKSDKNRKKKDKGKQREDPLRGLIQMDGSEELPTADPIAIVAEYMNPTIAGPSNNNQHTSERQTSAELQPNDLVRIDMGQMLQLKNIGYEAVGPVNGPNEGYPEYEVPQAVLQALATQSHTIPTPIPIDSGVAIGDSHPDQATINIDPSLLGHVELNASQINDLVAAEVAPNSGSSVRATTPCNVNADSAIDPIHTTPKKQLGKRAQPNVSPQGFRQTRGNRKKKKVTDDDLAAMEAQNMVQSGSRRRIKPTRRR